MQCAKSHSSKILTHKKPAIPIGCNLGSAAFLPLCYAYFSEERANLFTADGSASTLVNL